MGKKKDSPEQHAKDTYNRSVQAYNETTAKGPSQAATGAGNFATEAAGNYGGAVGQAKQDYGNIMGGYQNFMKGFNPKAQMVSYKSPQELQEGYGYMREAVPGYRDFANTGGYSGQDIQELRARGTSPIRTAYANSMQELDRARALGGNAGAPNYIAAVSRAQREQPGQIADAMTNVNAKLAEDIRAGKLQGLAGLSGIGQGMGGMSLEDARLGQQAALANQSADLQAQQLGMQGNLGALSGMQSLYGTTPGMANMFGNQALEGFRTSGSLNESEANQRLGLLNNQLQGAQTQFNVQGTPLWKDMMNAAIGGAATYYTGGLNHLAGAGAK